MTLKTHLAYDIFKWDLSDSLPSRDDDSNSCFCIGQVFLWARFSRKCLDETYPQRNCERIKDTVALIVI